MASPRGRGVQMNAGARRAVGDALLFLHADSTLPAGYGRFVETALESQRLRGPSPAGSAPAATLMLNSSRAANAVKSVLGCSSRGVPRMQAKPG